MTLHVLFTEDGVPGWIGDTPKLYTSVGGVSAVTGVTVGPVSFQTEPY